MNKENFAQKPPLINRIFFGFITATVILFLLKMAYEVISPDYKGPGTGPPFPHSMILFGTMVIGFVLITFCGDIRLRLHKIWTPFGILGIFWVWLVPLKLYLPVSSGVFDALLNYSVEAWIFFTGFGLMLAFVDFPPLLYKYAYYFIPATLYSAVFLTVDLLSIFSGHQPALLNPSDPNFLASLDHFNDFFFYISGIFFAYYTIVRLKREWPGWKKIGITLGLFFIGVFLILIISHIIGNAFPKDSRLGQWFTGDNFGTTGNMNKGWPIIGATYIIAVPVDLTQIQSISKYRSCAGDVRAGYSFEETPEGGRFLESDRSMEHYLYPIPEFQGTLDKVKVFAPFDGEVASIILEKDKPVPGRSHPGNSLMLSTPADPNVTFVFGHIYFVKDFKIDDKVTAGELIGYAALGDKGDDFDIDLTGASRIDNGQEILGSIFDHMNAPVLAEFAKYGITPENTKFSIEYRNAHPCDYAGQSKGKGDKPSSSNWIQLKH